MKKIFKLFCFCFILFFASITAFFANNNHVVYASQEIQEETDLESFLQFEKAIINLNKDDNVDASSSNQTNKEKNIKNKDQEYELKRMIVKGPIKNTYGAIDQISYNNLHVLCYSSEEQTEYAYKQLAQDTSLKVVIDKIEKSQEYAEHDYTYDEYTNWGPQAADVAGYREFLVDNNVEQEIVVVVLDTGINTSHPMFENRLLKDENGKIKGFSYYNSKYTYSYDNLAFDEDDVDKYSFEDDHSHGTHVAGIICDMTPENVKILPIKIGNSNGNSTSSIFISAYLRVLNMYSEEYRVVCTNLSFSGGGKDGEQDKNTFNELCYEPLIKKNILPITAAGNEFTENNIEDLKAVVVSSLRIKNDQYCFDSTYSNYGKIVDIAAPGTNIYSAGISDTNSASSSYVIKNGTSMASPQVAGVVALLYLNPNLPSALTAKVVEQQLYSMATDLGSWGKDIYYGHGMLNIKYFEQEQSQGTLSFYKDGVLLKDNVEYENFKEDFTLEIICSNSEYDIIYTTNKQIVTLTNSTLYETAFEIKDTICIYAMGVKVENGEIIARTNIYNISYFDIATPVEECFDIDITGDLTNYSGHFKNLIIPSTINGKTVTGLGYEALIGSEVETVVLPETATEIGGYALQYCNNLKYFYAPNVTKLYLAAFDTCKSLTNVYDTHPIEEISGVFLPNLQEVIGYSFYGCSNLETVSLSSLTTMDNDVGCDFENCEKLTSVSLPALKNISDYIFYFSFNVTEFEIGKDVSEIGSFAFFYSNLKKLTVHEENKYFTSDGKGVYSKDSLIAFASGNENIDYEILDSVEIDNQQYEISTICELSMAMISINRLILPEKITIIEDYAFYNSHINHLYYSATNCSHEGYSYSPWGYIETIEFAENVEQVPYYMFYDAFFDNVIINSKDTTFDDVSLSVDVYNDALSSIKLNFEEEVDFEYMTMLIDSDLFYNFKLLCSKTEINELLFAATNYFGNIYSTYDGEYYIYSEQELLTKYKIEATSNEYGSISDEGSLYVDEGTSKTYVFTPNQGYHVEKITIDGVDLTDDALTEAIQHGYTFANIQEEHTISVEFAINTYTITVIQLENGSISPAKDSYIYGETAQFTISANDGYHVECLIVDGEIYTNTLNEYTFTNISSDHYIFASFAPNEKYMVTIENSANGAIYASSQKVEHGSSLDLNIHPDIGYKLAGLYVNGVDVIAFVNNNKYTISNIGNDLTIEAVFELQWFEITSTNGDNGIILPLGTTNANYGTSVTYTITPDPGYRIKDVKVNGVSVGAVESYTFINVGKNQTIDVEFEKETFCVELNVDGKGSVKTDNDLENIAYGETVTLTILASKGNEIFKVFVNGESVNLTNNQLIIEDVDDDMHIQVVFKEKIASVNYKYIIIIGVVAAIIITTLLVILIIIARKNSKNLKLNANMANNIINSSESEPVANSLEELPVQTYVQEQPSVEFSSGYENSYSPEMPTEYQTETNYDSTYQQEETYQVPEQQAVNSISKEQKLLEKALEFVVGKDDHFLRFCARCNIDYQNDYNEAVKRYYLAYLRSLKK